MIFREGGGEGSGPPVPPPSGSVHNDDCEQKEKHLDEDEEVSEEGSKQMIMQKQENILTKHLTSNKQQCQHSSLGLVHSIGFDNHNNRTEYKVVLKC